ncbi:MAG: hypothetical protein FJ217_04325 [Ignavibacteria bacterium]|nr:hypothetical protein [Ignavibacteria bacterium]
MKRRWLIPMVLCLNLVVVLTGTSFAQKVRESEEIHRSFRFADGVQKRSLVVDNIRGGISVTGYDGMTIELIVRKEIEAESKEKIEEAKREIVLDIKEERDKVVLYVDAPWRTRDGINYKGWHYYGYDATYDFELKVPHKTSLYLKTVGKGKVIVEDVEGEFEVQNVNGGIEMMNVNGPADVSTVNGPVDVVFTDNPKSDCSFRTVNGKVEVKLLEGLSADLRFKTFNGSVYTDFDVTTVPIEQASAGEKKGRRWVYRRHSWFGVRAGNGGPRFSFDTLNGSIYVLKQD